MLVNPTVTSLRSWSMVCSSPAGALQLVRQPARSWRHEILKGRWVYISPVSGPNIHCRSSYLSQVHILEVPQSMVKIEMRCPALPPNASHSKTNSALVQLCINHGVIHRNCQHAHQDFLTLVNLLWQLRDVERCWEIMGPMSRRINGHISCNGSQLKRLNEETTISIKVWRLVQ